MRLVDWRQVSLLTSAAGRSPRLRMHSNLHESYSDPCQRLLNAIEVDSYIQPHKHSLDGKSETLIAIAGRFALFEFNDSGEVQEVKVFASERYAASLSEGLAVEIQPHCWHTVLALEHNAVLLEIKAGPFDPMQAKEVAVWAPPEGAAECIEYLRSLRKVVIEREGGSSRSLLPI
jgi:cupin fold WbuC family metalloprotein